MNLATDIHKEAVIHMIAETSTADLTDNITKVLITRKMYALVYRESKEDEPRHKECVAGIDFCNDLLKQILGIV
jgi:hypothetical protein